MPRIPALRVGWTFVALLLLVGSSAQTAQGQIQAVRGHLIDAGSLIPVGGATITVLVGEARMTQVLTRDDGSFCVASMGGDHVDWRPRASGTARRCRSRSRSRRETP